jgi:hypothetical protein
MLSSEIALSRCDSVIFGSAGAGRRVCASLLEGRVCGWMVLGAGRRPGCDLTGLKVHELQFVKLHVQCLMLKDRAEMIELKAGNSESGRRKQKRENPEQSDLDLSVSQSEGLFVCSFVL